jgi:hypothetical protein
MGEASAVRVPFAAGNGSSGLMGEAIACPAAKAARTAPKTNLRDFNEE